MTEAPHGNLFEQVKGLDPWGERISGEPGVLHDIEEVMRANKCYIIRTQIRAILERVPDVFAENWVSPPDGQDMTLAQQEASRQIDSLGIVPVDKSEIQDVIRMAVAYRARYSS